MNQYEVAVLYDPGLELDLDKTTDKVTKIFKDAGGKIVSTDNWGKRKLAYTIAKQDHAVYVIYTVELPADSIQKVESTFNITDEIIRFLITKPDLKAIAKAEAAKVEKSEKEEKRSSKETEENDKTKEPKE